MAFRPPRYNGPADPLKVAEWVTREFGNLDATLLKAVDLLNLQRQDAAPDKPREGDTRLADGVNWNPGAGQGVYTFYAGAWHKLG